MNYGFIELATRGLFRFWPGYVAVYAELTSVLTEPLTIIFGLSPRCVRVLRALLLINSASAEQLKNAQSRMHANTAGSGAIKLAIAAGLSPAAATGVGALPPAALAAWGAWNLKSAAAAWERSLQQWQESLCEDSSEASAKNFYGLLPGGTNYDDLGEANGPIDYIHSQGWWHFVAHAGYF